MLYPVTLISFSFLDNDRNNANNTKASVVAETKLAANTTEASAKTAVKSTQNNAANVKGSVKANADVKTSTKENVKFGN